MARRTALTLLFLVLLLVPPPVTGEEKDPSWFVNVAKDRGLTGVKAKDCIFTDLDGDGFLDLCLDRERLYLSKEGGKFTLIEDSGIEFPEVPIVPLKDGRPDMEKAKKKRYVPQYLYFADLDNDGDQDALWGVHSNWETLDPRTGQWKTVPECDPEVRSTVWLNDGKKFVRGPDSGYTARDAFGPAMALAIVDFDRDGNLDLYEGREYRQYGQLYGCGVDRLFKGDGKGGFTDVTKEAGLMTEPRPGGPNSSRPSYGVTSADVNNDGWPDLLQLAYGRQWNYLWLNQGGKNFKDAGMVSGFSGDDVTHGRYPQGINRRPEQPFRSNGNTFDCAVGDIDNDGDLDLFLGEIQHAWAGEASDPPALLVNEGEKDGALKFVRKSVWDFLPKRMWTREDRNWNLGDLHVAFADIDNDTRLDLLIGSGDYPDGQFLRLYHQQPDGTFSEVTDKAFRWEGCGDLSLGDYDRDGDVDILAGRSFMRLGKAHREKYMDGIAVNEVGLFENRIANRSGNHWLNVRLVGKTANRSGIGARIEVTAGGVTQIREIRCGSGLANHQDALEACFGLGKAKKVESITVRWPDAKGKPQVLKDVPADRFVTVTQGKRRPKLEKAR